jgi:AcrR family transcriptional regulator
MPAPKTQTIERQEQIVQAALELINDSGVAGLSIAGIAQKVGIVPSALYRHFRNKEAVLEAVLGLIRQRLLDNVAHVRELTDVPLDQLRLLVMRHAALLNENRAIPSVVFSEAVYTGDPEQKAKIAGIITGYLAEIQAIIVSGQQDGSIRKDLSPATAAVLFMGMILPAWPLFERSITGHPTREAS